MKKIMFVNINTKRKVNIMKFSFKKLQKKKNSPLKWKEIQYKDENNKIKTALVPSHMTVQKEVVQEYYTDTDSNSTDIDNILDTYTSTSNSYPNRMSTSSTSSTPMSVVSTPVSNVFRGTSAVRGTKTYSSSSSNSSDFFIPFVASPSSYYTKTGL
jgi:hypothetical protein